jgi:hypothetical protein
LAFLDFPSSSAVGDQAKCSSDHFLLALYYLFFRKTYSYGSRGANMRIPKSAAAAVAATYLCSCATMIHGGGQQTVAIATNPTGAKVEVGGQSLVSPAEITLSRDHSYQVVATKEGYEQSVTTISSRFSWVTLLDLIFIIPWVIDLVSGGGYYLEPDTLELTLSPAMRPDAPVARPFHPAPANE